MTTKRVLITGVSSGLGKALCSEYLQRGWQVYGLSRKRPDLEANKARFHFSSIDLCNFHAIPAGLDMLVDFRTLDLAILNAGMLGKFGDMHKADIGVLHEVMAVNVWSNKCIIDYLIDSEIEFSQVVAISSGASVSGARGWNGYGISKAALNMMIQLYSAEQQRTHFCALAPGLVDSAMQEHLSSLPATDAYPTLQRIQSRRGTDDMPDPTAAAIAVADCISTLPSNVASGSYVDIREYSKRIPDNA